MYPTTPSNVLQLRNHELMNWWIGTNFYCFVYVEHKDYITKLCLLVVACWLLTADAVLCPFVQDSQSSGRSLLEPSFASRIGIDLWHLPRKVSIRFFLGSPFCCRTHCQAIFWLAISWCDSILTSSIINHSKKWYTILAFLWSKIIENHHQNQSNAEWEMLLPISYYFIFN